MPIQNNVWRAVFLVVLGVASWQQSNAFTSFSRVSSCNQLSLSSSSPCYVTFSPSHKHDLTTLKLYHRRCRKDTDERPSRSHRLSRLFYRRKNSGMALRTPKRIRKALTTLLMSSILFLGPSSIRPPMAIASTSAVASTTISSSTTTTKFNRAQQRLDKMIETYVLENMFNEEQFDPFESAYRETISDATTKTYPNQLSKMTSSVLGKQTADAASAAASGNAVQGENQILKVFLRMINTLHERYNISKSILVPVAFLLAIGVPFMVFTSALMGFSISQRAMTERMAVKRYGESVLDAEEVIVEDDEDDDYDYESGEYDDESDDEDEDDDDDEEDDE